MHDRVERVFGEAHVTDIVESRRLWTAVLEKQVVVPDGEQRVVKPIDQQQRGAGPVQYPLGQEGESMLFPYIHFIVPVRSRSRIRR